MTLAIDIGNTNIAFGFLRDGRVERVVRMENMPDSELFAAKLENFLLSIKKHDWQKIIVVSVVPQTSRILEKNISKFLKLPTILVGRDVKVPIRNDYRKPRQVGMDRLVCAFAARELYGAPAIVIDLGTAVTFDAVSKAGHYLGGAIIPGLKLSAKALADHTALLPLVELKAPESLIGRSTQESIQSGLFHGYGALCDGMIQRFSKVLKGKPKVVLTGSYCETMIRFLSHHVIADADLVFKGMGLL